jgi:hypothetical protein
MTLKKFEIGTLILAMLLVCVVLVPAVSAKDNKLDQIETKKTDIYSSEKNIINQISSSSSSSGDASKAVALREKIKVKNQQEISDSVNNSLSIQPLAIMSTVTLGTDATYTTADYGNSGTSSWGLAPSIKGADYVKSSKQARQAVLVGPGGAGGAGAWAWIGKKFTVSGSGSRAANIRMTGHLYGLTSAFETGGSASSEVYLNVKDQTTGTLYSTLVYSDSRSNLGYDVVDQNFNNGVGINLQAGHSYVAYLSVAGSASVTGAGEAGSDFGPQDGDNEGYVSYSSIVVDF